MFENPPLGLFVLLLALLEALRLPIEHAALVRTVQQPVPVLVEAVRVPLQDGLARFLREALVDQRLEANLRYPRGGRHLGDDALLGRVHVVLHPKVGRHAVDQHPVVGRHRRELDLAAAPVHGQCEQFLLDLHQHVAVFEVFVERFLEELDQVDAALVGELVARVVPGEVAGGTAATASERSSATVNAGRRSTAHMFEPRFVALATGRWVSSSAAFTWAAATSTTTSVRTVLLIGMCAAVKITIRATVISYKAISRTFTLYISIFLM